MIILWLKQQDSTSLRAVDKKSVVSAAVAFCSVSDDGPNTFAVVSSHDGSVGAEVVVCGHSDPESSFGPEAIEETKKYFEDFERIAEGAESADEVYEKMMEVYPEKLNPGSLWSGAVLAKAK